ncbi:hypothetical protein [Morganella morganii]|uniref:hypothetical protein n=1 Tax=Morganella morganii TaxID=582 RepID=UPI0011E5E613|nr:hypothetical protein [Morganella morganii]MBS9585699.1 hypothetical protein [Morganella morganii subsp. morganii]QWL86902.1 hypothetical protein IR216_05855 [Morganella morganii subsp. morganii]
MKCKLSGLTTGQSVAILVGCVITAFSFSFFISWCLLHIWNWFAESAGFDLAIGINWGTVIGLSVILWVLKSIFGKKGN